MEFLEKIFKFNDNKTNIKTELLAGLTTFLHNVIFDYFKP